MRRKMGVWATDIWTAIDLGDAEYVANLVEKAKAGDKNACDALLSGVDYQKRTALLCAVEKDNAEIVRLILDSRCADVNAKSPFGDYSILSVAITSIRDMREIVKMLIDAGADVNKAHGPTGQTPLMDAVKTIKLLDKKWKRDGEAQLETIRLLVASGANLDAQDNAGQTVLIHAVRKGCYEIMRLLVELGADTTIRDFASGKTALDYAKDRHDNAMIAFLEQKECEMRENTTNIVSER